jgi:hypothetical protein
MDKTAAHNFAVLRKLSYQYLAAMVEDKDSVILKDQPLSMLRELYAHFIQFDGVSLPGLKNFFVDYERFLRNEPIHPSTQEFIDYVFVFCELDRMENIIHKYQTNSKNPEDSNIVAPSHVHDITYDYMIVGLSKRGKPTTEWRLLEMREPIQDDYQYIADEFERLHSSYGRLGHVMTNFRFTWFCTFSCLYLGFSDWSTQSQPELLTQDDEAHLQARLEWMLKIINYETESTRQLSV